jgi:amidase
MSIAAAYDAHDALGLAELVRRGEVTPTELLDEAIARVERVNPRLNAVVLPMYDVARRNVARGLPEGPLRGVPFLLKDLAAQYAGVPLKHGSRMYADNVPTEHSAIVSRYEQAGLVVFGKTNTSEMGILPTCETTLYGPCHNPWKHGYTTGGSSGGAAAAVAAGVVPAAHGGDAGGSIRIPASCCGVFGLKPTRGRNPFGPDASERAHGLAVEHVLTMSVRDSAAFLDATAGPEPTAPYWAPPQTGPYLAEVGRDPGKLRIGFTWKPILPGEAHDEQRRAVEAAAKLLASLGHEVEEVVPPIDAEETARHFFTAYCAGVGGELELFAAKHGREATLADVERETFMMAMIGRKVLSAGQFSAAIRELQTAARAMHRFHEKVEVLLTPTLGKPPVPHGALFAKGLEAKVQSFVARHALSMAIKLPGVLDKAVKRAFAFAPFTPIANVSGQPSMSVPLHDSAEGLPIGVCFTARFGDEATLFRLAGQLEAARPWRGRRPPVHAGG